MVPISVLGVVTIIGYGACFYAYGVLIGPIGADTGWPDAALGAVFSAALVITGAGGMVAGRVLDRRGPRPVFLVAGIAGAGAMLLASAQGALLPFAIAYAGGCVFLSLELVRPDAAQRFVPMLQGLCAGKPSRCRKQMSMPFPRELQEEEEEEEE